MAAALALAPTLGATATVTLSQQSNADIFGSDGRAAVSVTSAALGRTYNGHGGAFALKGTGIGNITTFCVDLMQYLTLPGSFDISSTPGTFLKSPSSALERLFETGFKGLDLHDNIQSAGFQLAVWEIAFETGDGYDIDQGNFKSNYKSYNNAAALFAKKLLAGMAGPITQDYRLTYYLSGARQDQVSVSAVPVPAAGGILLAGLAGLAALRRRRKAM